MATQTNVVSSNLMLHVIIRCLGQGTDPQTAARMTKEALPRQQLLRDTEVEIQGGEVLRRVITIKVVIMWFPGLFFTG